MLATAWPYAPEGLPKLTVQCDRPVPSDEADSTSDGAVDVYRYAKPCTAMRFTPHLMYAMLTPHRVALG